MASAQQVSDVIAGMVGHLAVLTAAVIDTGLLPPDDAYIADKSMEDLFRAAADGELLTSSRYGPDMNARMVVLQIRSAGEPSLWKDNQWRK